MSTLRTSPGTDRRSSVRVKSLLPVGVTPVGADALEAVEAQILDQAVIESDNILHDTVDWSERTDELSREVVFVLQELRAMRQQMAEMQRIVDLQSRRPLSPRWVVINDNGLFLPTDGDENEWKAGQFVEVRLQIPCLHTPEILALGEVVRVGEGEEGMGVAISFRYISEAHLKAIICYVLRCER